MIFSKKSEDVNPAAKAAEKKAAAEAPLPLKPRAAGAAAPVIPPRRPVIRPEVVRRSAGYLPGTAESDRPIGGFSKGKQLIVGRDIALNGAINACEKLIVEGRVEANISDCREIEVAESGTFKGKAEIDVAEISGTFEGGLVARELLMVRATGRITGDIRFGRLEVERGGEIEGNVGVYRAEGGGDGGSKG